MMSNKWAFSLTSLITILALAFVAIPTMAADDFDATFSVVRVSAKSDHNATYGADIKVTLTFGAQVDGTAAKLTIFVEDEHGAQTSVTPPDITAKDLDTTTKDVVENNNKVFEFTIPAAATDANDVKVHMLVAKGVPEIVPVGSAKSSKEGKLTIDLVGPDADKPAVLSIALAPGVIVPVAGYTGETIDVIITLSEKPKAFTAADHLNITEATAADPVALTPIDEQSSSEIQRAFEDASVGDPPRKRTIYDETAPPNAPGADANGGINNIGTDGSPTADEKSVRMKYGGIHRAIAEAGAPLGGTAYTYDIIDPTTGEAFDDSGEFALVDATRDLTANPARAQQVGLARTKATDTGALATPAEPSKVLKSSEVHPGVVDSTTGAITYSASVGTNQVEFPAGTDRTVMPTVPKPGDFNTDADYTNGLTLFNARRSLHIKYLNEKAIFDAYTEAVKAEQKMDQDARDQHYADLFDMPVHRGTGYDQKLHPFLVKITPKYENKNNLVVKVKTFEDQTHPNSREYTPPTTEDVYQEGVDKLTIKIGSEHLKKDQTAGEDAPLLKDGIIPKDGYLVVAKNKGDSAVRDPGDAKKSPASTARKPFALTYNLIDGSLVNLEQFLITGGTIDLVAPKAGLVISEIMWGTDASLSAPVNSQYIEIRNTSGAEIKMGDKDHKLIFYPAGSTLPDMSVAANNIQDRVSTVGSHGYWSPITKGQSGRTGVGEAPGDIIARTPTLGLISMQRVADATSATGLAADGTDPMSWGKSSPPGLNFDLAKEGERIGSPGRAPTMYPTAPTPPVTPVTVPPAVAGDIMITEIMVDTGDGRLPQWIELTNVSGAEKSLAGWSLSIENSDADLDVVGPDLSINLSGTLGVGGGVDRGGDLGKTLLLVAWDGRNSRNLEGNKRIVDVSSQVGETGRYKLISDMEFMISLIPPQKTSVVTPDDTAGNLRAKEAWVLQMSEGARSSLIRRATLADGTKTKGTAANGWILASRTGLVDTPATWYGSDEDAGTPGVVGGGPLPVELSHFRPARDKATGAVVITWATQSELNNAGFFIKRSNQRNGQFQVVTPTMIPGAGTTSEKQFYTYTDTTAQPNVVYYYQIEDVSLDGNRQILTRGTRLKGHVGAAGKATVIWGELKTSHE